MGYCQIFTMNPVTKIEQKDNHLVLHATHDMSMGDGTFMSSLIDDIQKHTIFTDSQKDWDLMDMSLSRVNVLLDCELEEMRTTTDVSKTVQDIRFTLTNLTLPNYNPRVLEKFGSSIEKCAIYPKILIYNGQTDDSILFFCVEDIQKTRRKKIEKIIEKKNVTIK